MNCSWVGLYGVQNQAKRVMKQNTKEIGGVSVSKASKTLLKFSPIAMQMLHSIWALVVKQL